MTEDWRPVPNFPNYEASSIGRIRSLDHVTISTLGRKRAFKGTMLSPTVQNERGRLTVPLFNERGRNRRFVHQVIAATFLGPRPVGMQVCHNNGDATDNRAVNLRYDTMMGNIADKKIHGTQGRGDQGTNHKISEAQARWALTQRGAMTCRAIGRELGVTGGAIERIFRGENWKHLQDIPSILEAVAAASEGKTS